MEQCAHVADDFGDPLDFSEPEEFLARILFPLVAPLVGGTISSTVLMLTGILAFCRRNGAARAKTHAVRHCFAR